MFILTQFIDQLPVGLLAQSPNFIKITCLKCDETTLDNTNCFLSMLKTESLKFVELIAK